MRLLFEPGLLLDDEFFLPLVEVLLAFDLFLLGELFAEGMSLGVLALFDESFEDLLILEQRGTGLESERLIQIALELLPLLDQLLLVRLLKGFQVSLAALDELFLVLVPVAIEVTNVFLLLLQQFVHFDIVLGQNGASTLVVFLVAQLLNFRLGFLSV